MPHAIDDIRVDVQEVGVPRLLSALNQAHGSVTGGLGDSGGGGSGMARTVATDNAGIPDPGLLEPGDFGASVVLEVPSGYYVAGMVWGDSGETAYVSKASMI